MMKEQVMRRLIRGKFDSRWKKTYNLHTLKPTGRRELGYIMIAMDYARYTQGGVKMIQAVRNRPWDTWRPRG
jgi:hypothetical protein